MPNDPQLPGMPEPKPGIWPDYAHLGREGLRVYKVNLSFSGSRTLEVDDENDKALASQLYAGNRLTFEVTAKITKTGHNLKGGFAEGTAAAEIEFALEAEEGAALRWIQTAAEMRSAAKAVEANANRLSDELSRHLRRVMEGGKMRIPMGLEEAHDALRAAIDHLLAVEGK